MARSRARRLLLASPAAFLALVALFVASVIAAARGAGQEVHAAEPAELATCGRPGQPRCPLQTWMRQRLAEPLARSRLDAVAVALDRLGRASPDPAWTTWRTLAGDGERAARRGDVAGVRRACKACHAAHRAAYRERHRTRPAPP